MTQYKHTDWRAGQVLLTQQAAAEDTEFYERLILNHLTKALPPRLVCVRIRVEIDYEIAEPGELPT